MLLQLIADAGMNSKAALSVSPADGQSVTAGESQSCLHDDDDGASENEHKPELEVSINDEYGPSVKKQRLEVEVIDVDEDDSKFVREADSDVEASHSDVDGRERETGDSAPAAKKSRLLSPSGSDDVVERSDRRRNKSTSAAVLLGLVRSRVSKLAAQRREVTTNSSAPVSSVSSSTTAAAAGDSVASTPVSVARTPKSSLTTVPSDWAKPFDLGKLSFTC